MLEVVKTYVEHTEIMQNVVTDKPQNANIRHFLRHYYKLYTG